MKRVLCMVLVILMIVSVMGTLIYNLMLGSLYAAAPDDDASVTAIDASADEKRIRVGLMYGTNVTVGFEVTSPYGFGITKVNRLEEDLSDEPLWETEITKVSCVVDANLSKSAMTYSKTSTASKTVIGGWHVEIGGELDYDGMVSLIELVTPSLTELGVYAIPSYIDGGWRVRAGHFVSKTLAESCAAKISEKIGGLEMTTVGPTDTGVALVDPERDVILFEYDDNDETALGLTALPAPDGTEAHLVTPAKKQYDGIFMFRRAITQTGSTTVDGVSLTDVISLADYMKGVLPYEISNSWPLESQKAFAICVRSFTLAGLGRHEKQYQIDMCNTQHCQVYNGCGRVNELVERAVSETAGQVLIYGDEIVTAFYSAVSGGVTVSAEDAWGGADYPYLQAIETPWEIYTEHPYGKWTAEVSPTELCTYLRDVKGYTQLSGKIVDISIDELATNSTYVKQITFTDSKGTKVTVKTTDGVRTALAKYVKSANFVVGKGSVECDETTFATEATESYLVRTAKTSLSFPNLGQQYVLTADGTALAPDLSAPSVITQNGTIRAGTVASITERVTVYAETPSNFIFAGVGYGHGVGLSQWGLKNLAEQGVSATEMLYKYFPVVEVGDYREVIGE
ncbi:MAG: SpoIID/LytB domain-containing protein [Clostridia bacterium]|nr:SpoIID/LytB domain-containing protein [Clostridia bacterium]